MGKISENRKKRTFVARQSIFTKFLHYFILKKFVDTKWTSRNSDNTMTIRRKDKQLSHCTKLKHEQYELH